MNQQLTKLCQIAQKPERLIVGLMSGTALDGLDIALCKISGTGEETSIGIELFVTLEYSDEQQKRLRAIQSKEKTNTRELTILHSELAIWYGNAILETLEEWKIQPEKIDLIASHGQTVFHAPAAEEGLLNSTLQIVDGDHIAEKTGIITISDFRQKHTAVGGKGAPLAGIFDELMFRSKNKNRISLNLGGIANFTWLPSKASGEKIIASDTGPANTLINEATQKYFDRKFDKAGEIALSGKVHSELVRYILLEPYFRKPFPKTTGQEDFKLSFIEDLMEGYQIILEPKDLIASLTAVTSQSVARAVDEIAGTEQFECCVSGGGVHNKAIMDDLKMRLSHAEFKNMEELGISPDAKEAAMMAFFANDLVSGDGFTIPGVTKGKVHLGKISLPG